MKCNLLPMFFEGFWEPKWYIVEIFLKKSPEEFCKKSSLKISQNSHENTCIAFSILINLHASGLQLYQKKEAPTQVYSCELSEIFKNTFFSEHLRCRGKIGPAKLRLFSPVFPGNKNLLSLNLPGN